MDSLNNQYRDVVEKVLKNYADFLGIDDQVLVELVFDRERDRTLGEPSLPVLKGRRVIRVKRHYLCLGRPEGSESNAQGA